MTKSIRSEFKQAGGKPSTLLTNTGKIIEIISL